MHHLGHPLALQQRTQQVNQLIGIRGDKINEKDGSVLRHDLVVEGWWVVRGEWGEEEWGGVVGGEGRVGRGRVGRGGGW